MRFALFASLLSAAVVRAEDAAAESSTSVAVEKPTFTPVSAISAPFLEQFTDGWESRWKVSSAKKDDKSTEEEWAYVGKWEVEEPSIFNGMVGDKGLVIKDKAAHHAISAKFPKKIDNKGKTLVVQYEVKLQNGLECGGAYMKILQDNKALHREEFSNASPYIIMFGPDKCGATNKVHFIFRHKNPKSGEYEEKHLKSPPAARITKTTTLYTLIIDSDQTYEIQIDGDSVSSGSLLEDFNPPVNPDKEIDDPEDFKPKNWVDDAKVPDPEATKPEDWDEDAPYEIVDDEATKPADWLEDEPISIPDPEAEKPEDWDDEEDGDWVAPLVPNPKCDEVSGCGKWEPPMKKNPAYKGKWTAPFIDNPEYKGLWSPRKISNPNFFEDKTPANLEPMGAIGFEIWTMQNDILFDNIYIGHSVEDAQKFKNQTFDLKIKSEKEQEEAERPKPKDTPGSTDDTKFMDDPVAFLKAQFEVYRNKFELFLKLAQINPLQAAQTMPDIAGGIIGVVAIVLISIISLFVAGPSKAQVKDSAKKAKDSTAEAKDKVAEAVSTGAEKAQAEVSKRTTRSQAAS